MAECCQSVGTAAATAHHLSPALRAAAGAFATDGRGLFGLPQSLLTSRPGLCGDGGRRAGGEGRRPRAGAARDSGAA